MDIRPELISKLETLLFAMGEPKRLSHLAKTLDIDSGTLSEALEVLDARYQLPESGLMIIRLGEKIQLASKGENAPVIERLRESELHEHLSRATLETLAIVAYRAPVTRADIDAIRGVNSNFTLRQLLIRGLIDREGNPSDARGYIYSPTFDFLKSLGLQKISDLPEYDTLSQDDRLKSLFEEKMLSTEDEVHASNESP